MVPGVNPVILLANEPIPEPLYVLESAVVGLADILQHTPCVTTVDPQSEVTFPPEVAVVAVIDEIAVVVIEGRHNVVNDTSVP